MRNGKFLLAALLAATLGACTSTGPSRRLGDPSTDGKVLAQQVCGHCHGPDGNSVSPQYPRLAGQQASYLITQLQHFEQHVRKDRLALEIMAGMSRDLTEKQRQEIAAYFAAQQPAAPARRSSERDVAGATLFRDGLAERGVPACAACHGAQAQGQGDYPRLAGQHKQYLVKQMHVFRDTDGRPDTPMGVVVRNLTEKEIDLIASYLAALP